MSLAQIMILDFGSQYTQLLARKIREENVLAIVSDFNIDLETIKKYKNLKAIILSGGPSSIYLDNAYKINEKIFNLGKPILGVCYGMQLITQTFKGKIALANTREFGKTILKIDHFNNLLFDNVDNNKIVWMSHSDHLNTMPKDFVKLAHTDNCIAAIGNLEKQIYAIQFHPEVTHSEQGQLIMQNFLFKIAKCQKNWKTNNFINNKIKEIQEKVKDKNVILGLSGGVDSTVSAVLLNKAIGKQLTCIFVDTGLLRKNERKTIITNYHKKFNLNIKIIDASKSFYQALKGISNPERKRKIIGKEFIKAFYQASKDLTNVKFLAQGTIYPDIIESSSSLHQSKTIKSHHNVGGIPKNLKLELLEPLKNLFKDEVKKVGISLGIPRDLINRHPFPGPGLGIRIIGEITKNKCQMLQKIDDIFIKKLTEKGLYNQVSQAFVTLLPVKTVGVMGDKRTYKYVTAIRCVNTIDFMTASFSQLPWDVLEEVTNEIINKVSGVNRVVYDITSKTPATIEWE